MGSRHRVDRRGQHRRELGTLLKNLGAEALVYWFLDETCKLKVVGSNLSTI